MGAELQKPCRTRSQASRPSSVPPTVSTSPGGPWEVPSRVHGRWFLQGIPLYNISKQPSSGIQGLGRVSAASLSHQTLCPRCTPVQHPHMHHSASWIYPCRPRDFLQVSPTPLLPMLLASYSPPLALGSILLPTRPPLLLLPSQHWSTTRSAPRGSVSPSLYCPFLCSQSLLGFQRRLHTNGPFTDRACPLCPGHTQSAPYLPPALRPFTALLIPVSRNFGNSSPKKLSNYVWLVCGTAVKLHLGWHCSGASNNTVCSTGTPLEYQFTSQLFCFQSSSLLK